MAIAQARPTAPTDDPRWRTVEARMRRLGNRPDAVIEALHTVQETFGHIDRSALRYVSASLGVPPSTVFGVATFYHYFKLEPQGEHACTVCTGTACYIDGALGILQALRDRYGLEPGRTSADGRLSLHTGRCFGSCSLAPAAIVDGSVLGHVATADLLERLDRL